VKNFLSGTIIMLVLLAVAGAIATGGVSKQETTSEVLLPDLINVDEFVPHLPPTSKNATDSLYLLGGPGVLSGKFETAEGLPDRQGWTGVDVSQDTDLFWQVSTFNAAALDPETSENHAWWCGDIFESCNEEDPAEGYGNNWIQFLYWKTTVPDPNSNVTVRIEAVLSYDIEPGEEFLYCMVDRAGTMETLESYSYRATAQVVDLSVTLTPADLTGPLGDQVHLRWQFSSDGAWSDEDCQWPTAGAAQIDLIKVSFDQGAGPVQMGTTETCEPGDALQWYAIAPQGAGDFSKVWPQLDDADPNVDNLTRQFAFIDDGLVVPGTGGFPCTTHCYGPGGFIVNPSPFCILPIPKNLMLSTGQNLMHQSGNQPAIQTINSKINQLRLRHNESHSGPGIKRIRITRQNFRSRLNNNITSHRT